jgi:hypothetical protein
LRGAGAPPIKTCLFMEYRHGLQQSFALPFPPLAQRLAWGLAATLAAATLVLSWLRLFYGVDLTDESFYVALPYRFALGDLPLRDEQNLAQFAGVLLLPLIRAYLRITGGTDGIVLYARHLHLAFTLLTGLSVFLALRRCLHGADALLTASVCLVFVPFTIHGLSYNTLGSGLLTIGCFVALLGLLRQEPRAWPWTMAGLAHGLGVLVYPTLLAFPAVFMLLFVTWRNFPRRQLCVMFYGAGGLLAALVPAWLVLRAGVDSVAGVTAYLSSFHAQAGGLAKLQAVATGFWRDTPHLAWMLGAMAAAGLWHLLRPGPLRWALPVLPFVFAAYWVQPNGTDSLYLVMAVALAGPFAWGFVKHQPAAAALMRFVWLPSFVAGLTTAWSSSNGVLNACIGIFPAALASLALMQLALSSMPARRRALVFARAVLVVAVPLTVLYPLLAGGYADYYGEPVQRDKLTERVNAGPYAGLLTTPERAGLLRRFREEAAPQIRPEDRLLVFNDWPGGYLLAGVRPATNSVWLPPSSAATPTDRRATFDYWQKTGRRPDLVLLMKASEKTPDPLLSIVQAEYAPVADLGIATLRRRRTAP